ncbi:lamin tail domain-containing protein [Halomicrobium salinisoli]|uniref:lamin tail domain-containing protein n=1 Tax=Halomicrobium salinisoli TaxID=2878391 RepID=UPI001CF026C7|nr:lamin tail domain-containing protein [Halomicrobium salinisoli]
MTQRRLLAIVAVTVLVAFAGCTGALDDGATAPNDTVSTTVESTSPTPTGTPEPIAGESVNTGPNGTLSVHFINVGQSASTLIVGPNNETMLVDSGDWTDDGEDVLAYLERHDVERIDYLVTTHADADHIGGHAAVINHYETNHEGVGAVYDPGITSNTQTYQEYLDAIETHDVTLYETRAGDRIPFEGVDARVLAPPEGYLADGDRNENSIVLHLEYGQSSFLLPGDVESAGERYLVDEYGAALNTTVLSAGHHGSGSSSGSEFLAVTDPRIAVISSAYDSQYGHPHEEVLQRYADRDIRTYWTATHGNVRLTSNGSAITVATQREAPTAPLELRDGEPIEPGVDEPVQPRMVIQVDGSTTTPVAPDGGTTATASPSPTATPTSEAASLSIATIHADADGNDNENLNDEYVVFENEGTRSLDLGGWTVTDGAGHTYTFPSDFVLDPGAKVTVHTGSGTDSATDLYWGAGSAVWNNAGDTVTVRTEGGTIVLQEEY